MARVQISTDKLYATWRILYAQNIIFKNCYVILNVWYCCYLMKIVKLSTIGLLTLDENICGLVTIICHSIKEVYSMYGVFIK